jgi:hypothetical protein
MTSGFAAQVDLALRRFGARRAVLSAIMALLVGCASSDIGPSTAPPVVTPPPPAVTVTSVTVAGASTGKVGDTSQLAATAIMSDGTTQTVTSQATWESSNTATATVSASGLASFVAAGEVDIKATYKSVTGTLHLSISPLPTPHYNLSGTITDKGNGKNIFQATVLVVDGPDAGRSVQTDSNGMYTFSQLTAGTFTLKVTHGGYLDVSRQVTLSSNLQVDIVMISTIDVSANYGTFNVSLTVLSDDCEFPPMPDPNGTLKLSGQDDGSGFSFSITERGTTRSYSGTMDPNGSFRASGTNLFVGAPPPTHGPSVREPTHDSSGTVTGSVNGRRISGSEDVTFGAPCPGRRLSLGFDGSK